MIVNDRLDLRDRGKTAVPDGLCVVASERVDQLGDVDGIGPSRLEKLRDLVRV